MPPEKTGGMIVQTLENLENRVRTLENGLILNEERDKRRDEDVEGLRKEVRQNTTTLNTLAETLGGDYGLISTTERNRDSFNKSAGVLAFVGVVVFTIAGWGFWTLNGYSENLMAMVEKVAKLEAKAE